MTAHTIWWWDDVECAHLPVPLARTLDTRDEAIAFAASMTDNAWPNLAWVRVFRADNEAYEVFHWRRPDPAKIQVIGQPPPSIVTLRRQYAPLESELARRQRNERLVQACVVYGLAIVAVTDMITVLIR